MPGSDSNNKRSCNQHVKALCHKAMARGHTSCHKQNNASNMMGSKINIFLSSVSAGTYGVESRDGITTEVNAVEDDNEYMVCANTKTRIEAAVAAAEGTRKRKSRSSPASTATTNMNTTTCFKVTFVDGDNDTVEVHAVFDDDVEKR